MKTNVTTSSLISLVLVLAACGSDSSDSSAGLAVPTTVATTAPTTAGEVARLWIGPELVDCVGSEPQKCMVVAESENGEPEFFYDQIAGFAFVEGFDYVIDVEVEEIANPPADGSSIRYTLVEVIEEVATD